MEASRIDTLDGPQAAARVPFLVLGLVLAAVLLMLAIGAWGPGWWVAVLIPVMAGSLALAGAVVVKMRRASRWK